MKSQIVQCLTVMAATLIWLDVSGCTYDISNRQPYIGDVRRVVYLRRNMKLLAPRRDYVLFPSHPYVLVDNDYSVMSENSDGTPYKDGTIAAVIPAGTPLDIERVVAYRAFETDENDALGTVYVPELHQTIPFEYSYDDFHPNPWRWK